MSEQAEVICGDPLYGCRCGLPPGHDAPIHECAELDPQCGGMWRDHETDPNLVYVVRWPGRRPGGPNEGRYPDLVDPGPDSTVIEPRHEAPMQVPRGAFNFLPPPSLTEMTPWSKDRYNEAVAAIGKRMEDAVVEQMRTPDEPEFVHDKVFARFPKGTDPLEAVKAAMGVFMERTDGTNAMGWWSKQRWWHGGPDGLRRGQLLLPPSRTGVLPGLDATDRDSVYITTDRDLALLFAARHNRPMLYEVTKIGEPSPDDTVNDDRCWRVPSAVVYRIEVPSTLELRRVLYELNAE